MMVWGVDVVIRLATSVWWCTCTILTYFDWIRFEDFSGSWLKGPRPIVRVWFFTDFLTVGSNNFVILSLHVPTVCWLYLGNDQKDTVSEVVGSERLTWFEHYSIFIYFCRCLAQCLISSEKNLEQLHHCQVRHSITLSVWLVHVRPCWFPWALAFRKGLASSRNRWRPYRKVEPFRLSQASFKMEQEKGSPWRRLTGEPESHNIKGLHITYAEVCCILSDVYIYIYTYLDIGTISSFLSYIIHAKSPHSWQEKGCTIPQPITVNLHGVQLLRSWRDSFHLQGLPKPSLAKVVRASNPFVSGCLLGGTSHWGLWRWSINIWYIQWGKSTSPWIRHKKYGSGKSRVL